MAVLLKKGTAVPVSGLDYSQPASYLQLHHSFPSNMRYLQGEIRKREGSSALGSAAIAGANGILHLGIFKTDDEAIRLLRASKTKLERYNVGSAAWDDITGASSFSGGDDDYFDDAVVNGIYIGTNYINVPWTLTDGASARAALGGSPPKCKFLEYLEPYLVAGYVETGTGHHMKVQWADTGTIATWTGGNAGSALLAHDGDPLKGLKGLGSYCAGYKKNSIYLGRAVDTSDVVKWDLQEIGTGLMNHRCVVEHRGIHYLMSLNDFRVFNGVRSDSIGGPVRDFVFNQRNIAKDKAHFALHVKDYEEIWWYVAMAGLDYPRRIFKYNYRFNFWYEDTCTDIRAAVEWFNQSSITINELVGSIDSQANRIDDYLGVTNSPTYVFGGRDGLTSLMDRSTSNDVGVAIDAKVDTIDFVGDEDERFSRWVKTDYWAKGNSLRILYSTEEGTNWKLLTTQTLDGTWRKYTVWHDILSEKLRLRFANNTLSSTFWIRRIKPYYLAREDLSR